MFSRSSGYAPQALTYLAVQPSGRLVGAKEIATRLDLPMPFLWKILRKLSAKKLVRSFKGARGGYELARPAKNIRVSEVFAAGTEGDQMGRCVLGLDKCDDRDPCPLHSQWKSVREEMEDRLQMTTLADLAEDLKPVRVKRSVAVQSISA